MTIRYMRKVLAVGLLMWGVAAVSPAGAQSALPEEGGLITLVGCFQKGGPHNKYVLANPRMGSVVSVTEGTCSDSYDESAVELKDLRKMNKGTSILGRVVEISGRLEKLEGHIDLDDIRELHVRTFRAVPVVPPREAEAPRNIPSAVQPQASVPRQEQTIAAVTQTEVPAAIPQKLPKTASPLPVFGLVGLLLIGAACTLRLFNPVRSRE